MQKRPIFRTALILFLLLSASRGLLTARSLPDNAPFGDDLTLVDSQMADLTNLEQLVQSSNTSLSQLLKEQNPLTRKILPDENIAASLFGSSAPDHEMLMDIPGFLWGFCCSFVGMFLVYLSIDDPIAKNKEGKQAILGCAVGTVLWVGLYISFLFILSTY